MNRKKPVVEAENLGFLRAGKPLWQERGGSVRFEDSKKRASGTCLVDLRGGRFDRERSTRTRGGGHLLRDIPGGQGLRGRGIDAGQLNGVGLAVCQGGDRQGSCLPSVPEKSSRNSSSGQDSSMPACSKAGVTSASETPPGSAFGQGVRYRNHLSWKIRRGWYLRKHPGQ